MRWLAASIALLTACAPPPGGAPDAGQLPLFPDPSEFDCRAPAPAPPAQPSPDPCLVDRACRRRLVTGHRGAGGEMGSLAPENSLSAVRAAIALGIDYVETDPRPTKDGVLVNAHDDTVDRVTTGSGAVAELSLAELQALPLRADKYSGDFSCDRVPTLRAVLELARGRMMVLVDANKTDRVDLLVKDIVDADALEWAVFDTSSPDKIDQALALEPRLLTMIRVDTVFELDAQLARFAQHPPIIVEVARNAAAELAPVVRERGHRPFTNFFSEDLTVALGGKLSAYDKPWALGVDIGQTDRPAELMRYLGRR